jgi:hypothetical protein
VCGATQSVHQAARGGTCDDPSCRRTLLLAFEAERRRLREQALRREVEALRRLVTTRLGLPAPDSLPLALLPASERATLPASRRRLGRLREHLERELAAAIGGDGPEGAAPAPAAAGDDAPDRLLAAGCALCRGHCCATGDDHAHLKAEHLRRRLDEQPGLGADALLEAYLSHVPARSYRLSCIYHAPGGCTLPRTLRSDVCNSFLCNGLKDLRDAASRARGEPVLVAATAGASVVRLALVEAAGGRSRGISTRRARVRSEPPCSGGA